MVKIARGSLDKCREALRTDDPDLEEFPLRTYEGREAFSLGGVEIAIIQGVNLVPHERFRVRLDTIGEDEAVYSSLCVPGLVPFLGSARQVTLHGAGGSPTPDEVGLPMLPAIDDCMVRWMFGERGERNEGFRLWRRLEPEDIDRLPETIRPDPEEGEDTRSSYTISRARAYPEPPAFVAPRAEGYPHEPWLARSVECAESWRVVVPNTSRRVYALPVPPTMTIIGDNYNVLLVGSGVHAVAISVILSTQVAREYIEGIAPWSKGGTPRTRSKHVNAGLWNFQGEIEEILDKRGPDLQRVADDLEYVWERHVLTLVSLCRETLEEGPRYRDLYTAIGRPDALDETVTGVEDLVDEILLLATDDGEVKIEFRTAEDAGLAAVAAWTLSPLGPTVDRFLETRLDRNPAMNPDAVRRCLIRNDWSRVV